MPVWKPEPGLPSVDYLGKEWQRGRGRRETTDRLTSENSRQHSISAPLTFSMYMPIGCTAARVWEMRPAEIYRKFIHTGNVPFSILCSVILCKIDDEADI